MKKMLLATALALLITGCAQQTFTVQNDGSSSTRNHHPSFRFWNWAKENCRCSQNLKMLLKQKPQQTFVNGLLGFITLGIYASLEARVLLTIIA